MTNISRVLLMAAAVATLGACDDNSWNDHELPGFEEPEVTDVKAIDYTLSSVDYKTLADNSTNKALAGQELASALAAVGSNGYFNDKITARDYVPALLSDPKFPYFTLSDGSSIRLTYRTAQALPEEIEKASAATRYVVTDEDYQATWGSDTDYAPAFAPSHTPAASIPAILAEAIENPEAGSYVIVNYQVASQDPVFHAPGTPDEPEFALSSVLTGTYADDDAITINGIVTAVSTQGPVVSDAAGSIFVYGPEGNSALKVGDQVVISSVMDSYNMGYQIASGAEVQVQGSQAVDYPAPKALTAAEIDALAASTSTIWPVYAKFTGKATVGNFVNVEIAGTTVQASAYGLSTADKAKFKDGENVTLEGYVVAVASKGKYLNTVVTKIGSDAVTALPASAPAATSRAVDLPSVNENALYTWTGSRWQAASGFSILSHADYQAMGQRYDNLSGETPDALLPLYLEQTLPYAQPDDTRFVVYAYYDGSSTSNRCVQYLRTAEGWKLNDGVVTEQAQFVRNGGKWMYDPNVTITLPAGRGQELSTLYFQTCVDWIKANVPDGASYVSSYGNNEYYCGTSAYQGNVDLRPTAARTQNSAAYASMTDDEIVAVEKERFEKEVMPGALHILHPDATPVEGLTVLYTINFFYYTGTTHPATVVYEVTAPGTFTFVSADWAE